MHNLDINSKEDFHKLEKAYVNIFVHEDEDGIRLIDELTSIPEILEELVKEEGVFKWLKNKYPDATREEIITHVLTGLVRESYETINKLEKAGNL